MSASISFLLITVILMVVQRNTFGLNCYVCSVGTDGCSTSFNTKGSGVMQISGTSNTYCAKAVYASNANSIARLGATSVSCTATTVTATASTTGTGSDGYTLYCCTTDLCNGSLMKSASVLLAMAAATLIFFLKA